MSLKNKWKKLNWKLWNDLNGLKYNTHFIAVICYELQEIDGLVVGLHIYVQLPGKSGLAVHDIGPVEPSAIALFIFILFWLYLQEDLLSLFVIAGGC